jgi:hypothetical protein
MAENKHTKKRNEEKRRARESRGSGHTRCWLARAKSSIDQICRVSSRINIRLGSVIKSRTKFDEQKPGGKSTKEAAAVGRVKGCAKEAEPHKVRLGPETTAVKCQKRRRSRRLRKENIEEK